MLNILRRPKAEGLTVRQSIAFVALERYLGISIGLVTTSVVSRVLTPREIGIAALGTALVSLVECLREFGTANYLIQHERADAPRIRSAFTMLFCLSAALAIVVNLAAQPLANYYAQPELEMYIRLLSIPLIVNPFSGTILALLRREMEFGQLAMIGLISTMVSAATTVMTALAGQSYMCIAWGALAYSLSCTLLAILGRPNFSIFVPKFDEWGTVFRFGALSTVTGLANRGYELLPVFLIGNALGPVAVGFYSRAQLICQIPDRIITTSVAPVALPAFSQHAREGGSISTAYLQGLGYISAVHWPAFALIALLADPIVAIALGPQWSEIVPIVQLIAVAMLFFFPSVLSYPVLVATGGVAETAKSSFLALALSALMVWLVAPQGPYWLAAAQLVIIPMQIAIVLWYIRRRVPFTTRELLRALQKSVYVTLATLVIPAGVVIIEGDGRSFDVGIIPALLACLGAALSWVAAIMHFSHPLQAEVRTILNRILRRQ